MVRRLLLCALLSGIWLGLPVIGWAQRGLRDHIMLPATRGATVLSTYIDSQARLRLATGDYLESVAVARLIHTEAASREMDNALKYVETYFERKLLNKDYRWNKMYTPHVELEKKRNGIKTTLITYNPEIVMEKDLTKTLNWMLVQLSTYPDAQMVLFKNDKVPVLERFNFPLYRKELENINVCLIERNSDGKQTVFTATGGSSLMLEWPGVLQKNRYLELRNEYDEFKTRILKDGQDGKIEYVMLEEAEELIDRFHRSLDEEYPKARLDEPKFYFEHKPGSSFLDVQLAAIKVAVISNNTEAITGEYSFEGDNLFKLLNHMSQNGLQFSQPKKGKEHVYTKLFLAMRNFYLYCQGGQPDQFNGVPGVPGGFKGFGGGMQKNKRPGNVFFGDN